MLDRPNRIERFVPNNRLGLWRRVDVLGQYRPCSSCTAVGGFRLGSLPTTFPEDYALMRDKPLTSDNPLLAALALAIFGILFSSEGDGAPCPPRVSTRRL